MEEEGEEEDNDDAEADADVRVFFSKLLLLPPLPSFPPECTDE